MPQSDLYVENGTGVEVRGEINAHLESLVTMSEGNAAPAAAFPFQPWMDTNIGLIRQRNGPNTEWSGSIATGRDADILVTVGSGGDYDTVNEALADLSRFHPVYKPGGFSAEIRQLSGFVLAEQVFVSGIDLSWITITSVDAEVVIDRSALSEMIVDIYPAFAAEHGSLPVIGTLYAMNTSGTSSYRSGIAAVRGGRVLVSPGCGVKNTPHAGVYGYMGGYIMADDGVFSGNNRGVLLFRASQGSFDGATISGCAVYGVYSYGGSVMSVRNANCQMGAGPVSTDIYVTRGGIIIAHSATGGLSQTANSPTANGIIFQ